MEAFNMVVDYDIIKGEFKSYTQLNKIEWKSPQYILNNYYKVNTLENEFKYYPKWESIELLEVILKHFWLLTDETIQDQKDKLIQMKNKRKATLETNK